MKVIDVHAIVHRSNEAKRLLSDLHADDPNGWARYRAAFAAWQQLRDDAKEQLATLHGLL